MTPSFKPQAAAGLLGLALLLIVLAMGTGNNPQAQPTRQDNTYVEAMIGAPRFINPLLATSDTDTDLAHLIFSGLTRVDTKGNIVPDLAEKWDIGPDGKVYTFTLKSTLRWHDGQPLTSDDVFFTLGLLQEQDFPGDPALAAPWRKVQVNVPTKQTVVITLPEADASFLQYTTIGILPRHLWGDTKAVQLLASPLNTAPVGSGPWRVVQGSVSPAEAQIAGENVVTATVASEVSPQEGLLLEPNPYLPAANLKVSRLWFRLYPTFGAALTGLKLGELHGLGHIPPERMSEVAQAPGVTVHTQNLARYNMLLVNVRSPLFDKTETRQAIDYAIDRDALSSEGPATGQESPAHSPMLPHSWALDPNVQARIHNVEEAKRLLDAAGWKPGPDGIRVRDGVTLTVVLAANKDVPANVAAAEQIIQDLRQAGMDAQPALVSRDVLLHDYLGPRAFHLVLAGWEAEGADPDVYAYWHSSQAVTGGLNFGGWKSDAADKALQDARTATDRDARTRAYADFQRAFAQDVPAVILSTPLYAYASREPAECRGLPDTDLLTPAMRFDTINEWGLSVP